jgi:hypothetical protein
LFIAVMKKMLPIFLYCWGKRKNSQIKCSDFFRMTFERRRNLSLLEITFSFCHNQRLLFSENQKKTVSSNIKQPKKEKKKVIVK